MAQSTKRADSSKNSQSSNTRPYIRKPWERVRVSVVTDTPTMTQQSHRDQTDVNAIIARFDRTGELPPNASVPQYGDVSDLNRPYDELIQMSTDIINIAEEFQANWTPPEPEEPGDPSPPLSEPATEPETPAPTETPQ